MTEPTGERIYLSPPHLTGDEWRRLEEALASNWVAPVGPELDAFERELAESVQVARAVALSSGTAALHLALQVVGVKPEDTVLCSDLTFIASANAVRYLGAEPVFLDSEPSSWNLDPNLLEEELAAAAAGGHRPAAVISVDLYGQCADYDAIEQLCEHFEVPLIEDAAEALGATYRDRPAGGFGRVGVLSFNGNKIITTSGGGALLTNEPELADRARYLATQAREPVPHYEHRAVGYNYRMSNLLAAVGRAQLRALGDRVERRRANYARYASLLGDLPGVVLQPEAPNGRSTRWLTCLTIDAERFGADRESVRLALEEDNIEARPLWKPMHAQPVYRDCRGRLTGVSHALFRDGLCLPSGSSLEQADLERVAAAVRNAHGRKAPGRESP